MAGRTGQAEGVMPGNAAAVDLDRPFTSLSRFGISFLSRFEVSELAAPILDNISFVDTPGILSGEKQRVERGYSFEHVVEWFAERADRILLLFDGNKLDISDELKRVIECLKSHDDKIRIVLNKADMVHPQQLMRVYGALMWSLGKVIRSPEVLRVYIGSFWDEPVNSNGAANAKLFSDEEADLLNDLRNLPQNSAVRKINELVKRARLARVHALLVNHLRASMPYLWGHKKKQERLALRLKDEYVKVQKAHGLAIGDFPAVEKFRSGLEAFDLSEFPNLSKRLLDVTEGALSRDIPKLMLSIGITAEETGRAAQADKDDERDGGNPFGDPQQNEGEEQDAKWAVTSAAKAKWDRVFDSLKPSGTPPALHGAAVRDLMLESGLPPSTLKRVWDLADINKDGLLDAEEFAVAMTLIKKGRSDGISSVPEELPLSLVPPSKR
ncbi:Cytoskeletal-regulatory complex EF hand [Gracilaria domingensis]|nr:Cytoskeletal-regulatory complex EF hand [Gracilaria domingensis]